MATALRRITPRFLTTRNPPQLRGGTVNKLLRQKARKCGRGEQAIFVVHTGTPPVVCFDRLYRWLLTLYPCVACEASRPRGGTSESARLKHQLWRGSSPRCTDQNWNFAADLDTLN
jgi:hypothetical protein